jgi:hypothetical protein
MGSSLSASPPFLLPPDLLSFYPSTSRHQLLSTRTASKKTLIQHHLISIQYLQDCTTRRISIYAEVDEARKFHLLLDLSCRLSSTALPTLLRLFYSCVDHHPLASINIHYLDHEELKTLTIRDGMVSSSGLQLIQQCSI